MYLPLLQVFDADQESELEVYLKRSADIYFGLSPAEVRKLAYDFSLHHQLKVPNNWTELKMAGRDWFSAFSRGT